MTVHLQPEQWILRSTLLDIITEIVSSSHSEHADESDELGYVLVGFGHGSEPIGLASVGWALCSLQGAQPCDWLGVYFVVSSLSVARHEGRQRAWPT
jgi:hypothetical protein